MGDKVALFFDAELSSFDEALLQYNDVSKIIIDCCFPKNISYNLLRGFYQFPKHIKEIIFFESSNYPKEIKEIYKIPYGIKTKYRGSAPSLHKIIYIDKRPGCSMSSRTLDYRRDRTEITSANISAAFDEIEIFSDKIYNEHGHYHVRNHHKHPKIYFDNKYEYIRFKDDVNLILSRHNVGYSLCFFGDDTFYVYTLFDKVVR